MAVAVTTRARHQRGECSQPTVRRACGDAATPKTATEKRERLGPTGLNRSKCAACRWAWRRSRRRYGVAAQQTRPSTSGAQPVPAAARAHRTAGRGVSLSEPRLRCQFLEPPDDCAAYTDVNSCAPTHQSTRARHARHARHPKGTTCCGAIPSSHFTDRGNKPGADPDASRTKRHGHRKPCGPRHSSVMVSVVVAASLNDCHRARGRRDKANHHHDTPWRRRNIATSGSSEARGPTPRRKRAHRGHRRYRLQPPPAPACH